VIKAEFSASLLQSPVHDPSEIILMCWFAAQETFIIVINVEKRCAASHFCGNHPSPNWLFDYIVFEKEIFCNIIHLFTVNFHQFNVFMLNKNIHFLKKILTQIIW